MHLRENAFKVSVKLVAFLASLILFQNCGVGFVQRQISSSGADDKSSGPALVVPHESLSVTPASLQAVHPIRLSYPGLIVATHYFPGWNEDEAADGNGATSPWAWSNINPTYSDRKPLQGWYKDGDPTSVLAIQNARLQIKSAAENGINLFIFNWFRRNTPNTPRSVVPALSSALHNGFMKANDSSTNVKFALNFTIESFDDSSPRMGLTIPFSTAGTSSERINEASYQLADVLYPYWRATYFGRSDYQRINGRPLILFLAVQNMLRYFGLPANQVNDPTQQKDSAIRMRAAMDAMRANAAASGDSSPLVGCSFFDFVDPGTSDQVAVQNYRYELMTTAGCDFHYDYANGAVSDRGNDLLWKTYTDLAKANSADPNMAFISALWSSSSANFGAALAGYTQLKTWDFYHQFDSSLSSPATLSVGWHDEPWGGTASEFLFYLSPKPLQSDRPESPTSYYGLLSQYLYRIQTEPTFSRVSGTPMLIVDAWNEYGEGHFIEPTEKFGFSYLEVLRYVLGNPSDRLNWPTNTQQILYP